MSDQPKCTGIIIGDTTEILWKIGKLAWCSHWKPGYEDCTLRKERWRFVFYKLMWKLP